MTKSPLCGIALAAIASLFPSRQSIAQNYLSHLHATEDSPLYTTYAAAKERSEFMLDVGYHMVFYDSSRGVEFVNQKGGNWTIAFAELKPGRAPRLVYRVGDFYRQPVITTSYSDIVVYHYFPFRDIRVDATFLVYSSHLAVQEIRIRNLSNQMRTVEIIPFLSANGGTFHRVTADRKAGSIMFDYFDYPDEWTVDHNIPHVDTVTNLFEATFMPDSVSSRMNDLPWSGGPVAVDSAKSLAFFRKLELAPDGTAKLRLTRSVAGHPSGERSAVKIEKTQLPPDFSSFVHADQRAYSRIPRLHFANPDEKMMYWSAFSLLRQCMLPPEGKCHQNYYVFSREPVWGWGHGGQVFHESLSMLAYVFMDPAGAMNSQKIFMSRQHQDGYIDYRAGPYLDETIPYEGQLTTSAPWFSWENWEIYNVTKDKSFLRRAYQCGKKFFGYWETNRDTQNDGMFEWGGQAVLESVRDDQVAVWDQVGWPSNFEGPDLNSMLVVEAKSLSHMAAALGLRKEAVMWTGKADHIANLVNKFMWDDPAGFYFNVDKRSHSFTYKKSDDLKRREIIGFLPMWAGIAGRKQASRLVRAMTDTAEFWRRFGVPSLAADDPYYNPRGYWNGPVWVEWNYLLERGLLKYGYRDIARQLVTKVVSNVVAQLKRDHYFWEFYSPDSSWAGYHRSYIWAGLVGRMLIDLSGEKK